MNHEDDFESAVWKAYADLFITESEAHAAIAKYRAERKAETHGYRSIRRPSLWCLLRHWLLKWAAPPWDSNSRVCVKCKTQWRRRKPPATTQGRGSASPRQV